MEKEDDTMKKNRMRICLAVGCIVLLLITVSACRPKPPHEEGLEKPQESFDASSVESVKQYYNYYVDRLAQSIKASGENTPSALTDFLDQLSFSVDEFTYVGDYDTAPDLLIFRDRTLFVAGKEYDGSGNAVPYTMITKLYNDGSAQINSYGDEVNVSLNTNTGTGSISAPDMQKVLEALPLETEDISALQKEKVYRLEKTYIKKLTEAFGWTYVTSLGLTLEQFCELTFTLDFSDYAENSTVTLTVSGKALKKAIVLTVDLSEYGEETGKLSLSLDLPTAKLQATLGWKDKGLFEVDADISLSATDMSIEIHYAYDQGAQPLPTDTPHKDCDTIGLSATIKVKGEEQFALTLSAAELEGNRYAGRFTLTMQNMPDNGDGSLLPISLTTRDNGSSGGVEAEGTFDIGCDDKDALASLNCEMTVEAAQGKLALKLEADLSDMKKGSEVARLQMTFTELVEGEAVENTMLLTLTVQSCTEDRATFSLVATISDEGEEETLMATLHWPAKEEIPLKAKEKTYLSRADALFEHYDAVMEKINTLNERAIEYAQKKMQSGAPLKYYYFDTATEQYLVTDISISGNQIYVNTNCVIDYEELLFHYAKHGGTFTSYTDSEAMAAAKKTQELIDEMQKGYEVNRNATYLVSRYLPDQKLYLVMFAGNPATAAFYTERVTQDMVSDYVLHEITSASDGTVNIHNFESRYDEWCRHWLTCKDCGFKIFTVDPIHTMSSEIEIRRGDAQDSRVTFCACEHCGDGYLTMTDQEGIQLRILLAPAKRKIQDEAEKYGDWALVIKGFEHVENERYYKGSLNIPNIEPKTGYRIVGAVQSTKIVSSLPSELVLPEGMEFIGRAAFRNCGFTSITLPSSLQIIEAEAFVNCRAKEIVIPENVTVVVSGAFSMSTLEKLTVNARFLEIFHLPYGAPALKEIIFNGQIQTFIGTSDCTIETLVIPEGVTSIDGFHNSNFLKKIVLPSTLTIIEDNAFTDCIALQEVVLPEGLLSIGFQAFSGCSSLSRVWVAGNGATVGEDGKFILPDTVKSLGGYAFARCNTLQSIRIPTALNVVSAGLFERCEQLTTVEMHSAITEIGEMAFTHCTKLSGIQMPDDLTVIGAWAFSNCLSLTDADIVFGNSLQTIGDRSFEKCSGIRNIRLPESVLSVDSSAFDRCQLDTVYVASKIEFRFGHQCWGASVNEITLAKGFTGKVPGAKTVNIMSTEVPEGSPHTVDIIPSWVLVINFAGTQEAWEKGNYRTDPSTQINFNVVFDEEANE